MKAGRKRRFFFFHCIDETRECTVSDGATVISSARGGDFAHCGEPVYATIFKAKAETKEGKNNSRYYGQCNSAHGTQRSLKYEVPFSARCQTAWSVHELKCLCACLCSPLLRKLMLYNQISGREGIIWCGEDNRTIRESFEKLRSERDWLYCIAVIGVADRFLSSFLCALVWTTSKKRAPI